MVCDKDVICDKVVGERWCVTKLCVTQLCVTKMVCDKVVCVCKMVCDKVVLTKWCVTMLCVTRDQGQHSAISATPATPATQSERKTGVAVAQTQPHAVSAAPVTQNEGRRRQVPRLPRETTMDVTKCHAYRV